MSNDDIISGRNMEVKCLMDKTIPVILEYSSWIITAECCR